MNRARPVADAVKPIARYALPADDRAHHRAENCAHRVRIAVNDQLHCAVTVKNNSGQLINIAIVDLGIPPGFDVDTTAFEAMQQNDQIAKFEATGNQVILYLRELSNVKPFQFSYSLRAKYPLRVQTPSSAVYEYYQPQNRAESKAAILQAVSN